MTSRYLVVACFVVAALLSGMFAIPSRGEDAKAPATQPASPLDFTLNDIDGHRVNLNQYRGQVVLLVNVASKCGYTPQYKGLESLYRQYKDQGLVVIGVPANNFGHQEPGTNAQIKQFCSSTYDVTFPMMSKISVKGDDKHPLYRYLTESPTAGSYAGEIGWNFTKFLIGRNGQVVGRFESKIAPDDAQLTSAIRAALAAKR